MDIKHRFLHAKDVLFTPHAMLIALLSFVIYVMTSFAVVLYIHETIGGFYGGMYSGYTVPFTLLTVILGALVGINVALFVAKLKELRLKSAGLGIGGLLFGGLAAGCPGCFFGLFPFVLSFFGISATLAILPFNGLEFQVFAIILLILSIYTLSAETKVACDITKRKKSANVDR